MGQFISGFEGKRRARRVISHLDESIVENTNEEVKDFDHDHGSRF